MLVVPLILLSVCVFLIILVAAGQAHPWFIPAAVITGVLGIILQLALTSGTVVHF